MNKFKKIIALMLAAVVVFAFAGCSKKQAAKDDGSDFDYITKKGKLIVGVTEYEPMDYQDDKGEWTGFDAEFAEAVAKKMGVEAEFVVIDWDNKFLELKSKSIDCIWNGMTITDEVNLNTACSDPYAKNEQVVVTDKSKADSYKSIDDMKDLKFAVESGSAAESAANDEGLNVVAVKAQSDALMEVQSGSVDACIIDITMADSMTGEGTSYSNLAKSISLTKEEYGIGFRKGSDMQGKINEYIKELKADGTLDKLSEKYGVAIAE